MDKISHFLIELLQRPAHLVLFIAVIVIPCIAGLLEYKRRRQSDQEFPFDALAYGITRALQVIGIEGAMYLLTFVGGWLLKPSALSTAMGNLSRTMLIGVTSILVLWAVLVAAAYHTRPRRC